ncbi:hypothetical protein NW768_011584 [Fusarium equiseti]|uniref:Uncharacterized protein n=1 Tax=Fusarium equiseti TaxID=61235 RepID=A0ABQ8QWY7_FUSEQ|nr:hypothetical protein NW768_011584 [Fusarium equiseti]
MPRNRNKQAQQHGHDRRSRRHGPYDRGQPDRSSGLSRPASSEALEPIPHVPEGQVTEISDHHGNTMTRADITSPGTRDPNNWVTHLPDGGLVGTSRNIEGIAQWLSRMADETSSTLITFTAHPVNQEKWEDVAKNAVQRRVRSTLGRDKDGKLEGIGENVGSLKPVKDEKNCPHCVNKAGLKHCLEYCISACSKGVVFGCVLCNTINHATDDCILFKGMNLTEKVDWLVNKRANKPPLKTKTPWYVVLHQYCMSPEFDADKIQGFPWSRPWTRHLYAEKNKTYLFSVQKRYDANRKFPLKCDPCTETFAAIWRTYWEEDRLQWPDAIGIMDQDMTNDTNDTADLAPVFGSQAGVETTDEVTADVGLVFGSQARVPGSELDP